MTNQEHGNKEQDNTGFVIKDRRRFDAQGGLREQETGTVRSSGVDSSAILDLSYKPNTQREVPQQPASSQPVSNTRSTPKATTVKANNVPAVEEEEDDGDINFSSFVVSLATQASIQLGLLTPPPGMDAAVDLEAAKQTIDILGLVERKTRGNLNDQEKNLLVNILHELRIGYVQIMKS